MRIVAVMLLLGFAPARGGPGAEEFIGGLDPNLWIVSSSREARLVVFRDCSREHCFTTSYLQWLAEGPVQAGSQDAGRFREMRTVAVGEVNDPGTFVREARWIGAPEGGYFLISVGNGYSGEPTAKVRVTVGPPGKYRVDKDPKS